MTTTSEPRPEATERPGNDPGWEAPQRAVYPPGFDVHDWTQDGCGRSVENRNEDFVSFVHEQVQAREQAQDLDVEEILKAERGERS